MIIDTLHFDTSRTDLDLDSRSQECQKANISAPIISQSLQLIWMEYAILLRRLGTMNLILILFCPLIDIEGREPYVCDFVKTKL